MTYENLSSEIDRLWAEIVSDKNKKWSARREQRCVMYWSLCRKRRDLERKAEAVAIRMNVQPVPDDLPF